VIFWSHTNTRPTKPPPITFCWPCISVYFSVISQLDAQNFCLTISLFHASTCFGHMCSKHVEAWSKLIVKRKFCASSWLITEINILFLFTCLNPLAPKVREEWRPKVEGSEGRHICSGKRGRVEIFRLRRRVTVIRNFRLIGFRSKRLWSVVGVA